MPVQKQSSTNVLAIFSAMILLVVLLNTIRSTLELKNSYTRLDDIKNRVKTAQENNLRLKKELSYVKSDEYLEKAAVEKLNMSKPDEKILIINENTPEVLSATKVKEPLQKQMQNWELWLKTFNF